MINTEEYKEKLNFIINSLPTLNRCSRLTKDRVCRSFRLLTYPAGHTLFKEGEFLKQGYLIKTGEIELYSRRNLKLINHINSL